MHRAPTLPLNDGRSIPQLGFGVWQVSKDDIVASVSKALEVGYRHIDTAAIYGNEKGVGKAIRESGIPREDLWVTTKLWNDRHGDARAALEESLEKLGLDWVDLYLIHWPVPGQDLRIQAWEEFERAQADGLVKSIGVSNFHREHLDEILSRGTVKPVVNQIELHPTFAQRELAEFCTSRDILIEAWSPLGQAQDLTAEPIAEIAAEHGVTPAQVIIRWHLEQGRIVFPKSVTPERIAENFEVFGFELSGEELRRIDDLDAGNRIGKNPDEFTG